jgi:chemotaxis protein MotB
MAGGAWKVAYADFVTAMMAFFLLLWLLATASEEQKEGLAEYFTPTIGIRDSAGIGFEGGTTKVTVDGNAKNDSAPPNMIVGQTQEGIVDNIEKESPVEGDDESQMFEDAKKEIAQAIESDPTLREFTENILMEQTPEGLKIEIRDSDKNTMFRAGSDDLSDAGRRLLKAMVPTLRKVPNHLSLNGHTDALAYEGAQKDYSNWELSADRALAARRYFLTQEMGKERVKKIVAHGSQELSLPDDPTSAINRRIEIILLRGSHMSLLPQSQVAPRSLLSVPNADESFRRRQKRQREQEQLLQEQNSVLEGQ